MFYKPGIQKMGMQLGKIVDFKNLLRFYHDKDDKKEWQVDINLNFYESINLEIKKNEFQLEVLNEMRKEQFSKCLKKPTVVDSDGADSDDAYYTATDSIPTDSEDSKNKEKIIKEKLIKGNEKMFDEKLIIEKVIKEKEKMIKGKLIKEKEKLVKGELIKEKVIDPKTETSNLLFTITESCESSDDVLIKNIENNSCEPSDGELIKNDEKKIKEKRFDPKKEKAKLPSTTKKALENEIMIDNVHVFGANLDKREHHDKNSDVATTNLLLSDMDNAIEQFCVTKENTTTTRNEKVIEITDEENLTKVKVIVADIKVFYDYDILVREQTKNVLADYLVDNPGADDEFIRSIESVHQARNAINVAERKNKDLVVGLISIGFGIDIEHYEKYKQIHRTNLYKPDIKLRNILRKQKEILVVHSNIPQDEAFNILSDLGIDDLFGAVYSPASISHNKKPTREEHTLLLGLIAEDFKVFHPQQIGYIDYNPKVLEMATQYGSPTALVLTTEKSKNLPQKVRNSFDVIWPNIYSLNISSFTIQSKDVDILRKELPKKTSSQTKHITVISSQPIKK